MYLPPLRGLILERTRTRAVPRTVEQNDLAAAWQVADITLEKPLGIFIFGLLVEGQVREVLDILSWGRALRSWHRGRSRPRFSRSSRYIWMWLVPYCRNHPPVDRQVDMVSGLVIYSHAVRANLRRLLETAVVDGIANRLASLKRRHLGAAVLVTTVNFPFVTTQNFSLWACR